LDDVVDLDILIVSCRPQVLQASTLSQANTVVLIQEGEFGVGLGKYIDTGIVVLVQEVKEFVIDVDDSLDGITWATEIDSETRDAAAAG
jgi:hypothetical protein